MVVLQQDIRKSMVKSDLLWIGLQKPLSGNVPGSVGYLHVQLKFEWV